MRKKTSLFALILLIVGAIDSIRNLPSAALFGSELVFFFLFAALVFLIPAALVAAELSSAFSGEGGIYHWVKSAFGDRIGMLAIWLQWINTMVWYPTILVFIAGTFSYLIDPSLASHKPYLIAMIIGIFWTLTLVNLRGFELSAKINTICSLIGMVFPMAFLITLGGIWYFSGQPMALSLDLASMTPAMDRPGSWISLTVIMASFLGIELSSVHVNEIRSPQKNFPKALAVSAAFILFTMLFGSLAIAFVLPAQEIHLVDGVMQVCTLFLHRFGLGSLVPLMALLIVIGSVGSMINWLISPAKGLLQAAELGYLPRALSKKNRNGVAAPILILQAVLVTLLCLAFLLLPSVNGFYWFLTDLSTELYMIMYFLMFLSAIRLHYTHPRIQGAFKIPGHTAGIWGTALLGILGTLITLCVGFFAPTHVEVGGQVRYALLMACGTLGMISPLFLFYLWKKKRRKRIG